MPKDKPRATQSGGGVLPGTTQQVTNSQLNASRPRPTQSGGGFDPRNPVGPIQIAHAAANAAAAAADVPDNPDPAPAPEPDPTTPDPYAAYLNGQRQSAFDLLYSTLRNYGIDLDGTGLAAWLRDQVFADRSSDAIMLDLRGTQAYKNRFTGMADLIARGQAISEAEYISQERGYANVLRGWGLPAGFYDDPTDFGKFISNGLSITELDDRIATAKTFLDASDPTYRAELNRRGVSDGALLAHFLDQGGERSQAILRREWKDVAFTGAANKYGFGLDGGGAYADTLGDQFNRIGADQLNTLESQLSQLGAVAKNQEKLAAIDSEAFERSDILDSEILSDNDKKMKSQRRGERERNRFSGSSAIRDGSLRRGNGV